MRILHVYKDFYPPVHGGIERFIHDLGAFLVSRGHRIDVLTASRVRSGVVREREVDGMRIMEAPCLFRLLSNPVCPGFHRVMEGIDADLVHFHHPLPTATAAWFLARPRIPHVITYHSDIVRQAALVPLLEPILWPFLRRASSVMATSPAYAATSRFLSKLRNVEIVPLGVDRSRFSPGGVRGGYFLFVGRFRRYKGLRVLLEAWESLEGIPLVLAGSGPLMGAVEAFRDRTGADVTIETDVDDGRLLELYRGARALILPSTARSEAFGMVQLEAMACGTPVISCDIPTGVPWVNSHGRSGLVVPPGDPAAMADAVRMMLDDDLRGRLSAGAEARAAEFPSDELFSRIEDICLRAAGAGRRA